MSKGGERVGHAVVLAQGRGERMAPFTLVRPKCLLPVLGQPLLDRILETVASLGVDGTVVVCGERFAPQVRGRLTRPSERLVVEASPAGSATTAWVGQEEVAEKDAILVLEGDVLVEAGDLGVLADSVSDGSDAAVLVAPLAGADPREWTVAERVGDTVRAFWGCPRDGQWRVAGAFALSPVARRFLGRVRRPGLRSPVGGMPPCEYDICESLNGLLERGGRVTAVEARSTVVQLRKPWDLLRANQVALSARTAAMEAGPIELGEGSTVEEGTILRGRVVLGRDSVVRSGAIIKGDVFVGDHCVVEDYAKVANAVLGHHCVIGHGAEIIGGVLMDNVHLTHSCEVYGVLGENVDIGAHTVFGTLRFDDGRTSHRVGQRWETPSEGSNACYLGDYVRTGVNVTMLPGKKVGAYSAIGPGVVVDSDVPAKTLVRLRQELRYEPWGPERYGW